MNEKNLMIKNLTPEEKKRNYHENKMTRKNKNNETGRKKKYKYQINSETLKKNFKAKLNREKKETATENERQRKPIRPK